MAKIKLSSGQMAGVAVICALVIVGGTTILVSKSAIKPLFSSAAPISEAPWIQLITPNGPEALNPGDVNVVQWTHTGGTQQEVVIYLYKGSSVYYTIANTVTSRHGNNSITWTVPSGFGGENYKVKVGTVNAFSSPGPMVPPVYRYDFSDYPFSITNDGLEIDAPDITELNSITGSTLYAGETVPIQWEQDSQTDDPIEVVINLFDYDSYGNLRLVNVIARAPSNKGFNEYLWTVPRGLNNNSAHRISVALNRRWPAPHISSFWIDKLSIVDEWVGGPAQQGQVQEPVSDPIKESVKE